jgi:hypothetical protein
VATANGSGKPVPTCEQTSIEPLVGIPTEHIALVETICGNDCVVLVAWTSTRCSRGKVPRERRVRLEPQERRTGDAQIGLAGSVHAVWRAAKTDEGRDAALGSPRLCGGSTSGSPIAAWMRSRSEEAVRAEGGGRCAVNTAGGVQASPSKVSGESLLQRATSNEQRAVAAYNLLGCGIISKGFAASEGEGGGG